MATVRTGTTANIPDGLPPEKFSPRHIHGAEGISSYVQPVPIPVGWPKQFGRPEIYRTWYVITTLPPTLVIPVILVPRGPSSR